jgi:hypothetical protein
LFLALVKEVNTLGINNISCLAPVLFKFKVAIT